MVPAAIKAPIAFCSVERQHLRCLARPRWLRLTRPPLACRLATRRLATLGPHGRRLAASGHARPAGGLSKQGPCAHVDGHHPIALCDVQFGLNLLTSL
jgi:hypothetical protein